MKAHEICDLFKTLSRSFFNNFKHICHWLLVCCSTLCNLGLMPLIYLAKLYDKNPILTLTILPFVSLPLIYVLIFVSLPGFVKAAVTVLMFVVFCLVRDR